MRVVDAAEFLQAVPHLAAAPCLADQAFINDDFLQHIVGINHAQAGDFVGQTAALARQGLVDCDHAAVPLAARNPRQMLGVALVTGNEVNQRERQVFGHALVLLVLVSERLNRPVEFYL